MSRVLVRPSIIRGEVEAPPSKPYTHRVYAAALLSEGISRVIRPLKSGDTEATRRACVLLGAEVNDLSDGALVVGGRMKIPEDKRDRRRFIFILGQVVERFNRLCHA